MTTSVTNSSKLNIFGKLKQHPVVLGLIFLIICCFAWLSYLLHLNLMEKTKQDLAMASAQNHAQQQLVTANTYLQQRQQQLKFLSEKDLFIDALASKDHTQIEHMEKLMADWVDDLSRGYLLSPEDTRLDKAHNFAGQKIARKVLAGEKPAPVAAYINGSWYLLFAYPINRDDETLGTILIMLGTDSLYNLLSSMKTTLGKTELYQSLPNIQNKAVITVKSHQLAIEMITLKTRVPHWEIRFTGSAILLNQANPSYREFFIILGALLAFMLVLLYLIVRYTLFHHKDKAPKTKQGKKKAMPINTNDKAVDETRDSYLQVLPSSADQSNNSVTGEKISPNKKQDDAKETKEKADDEIAMGKPGFPSIVFRDYDIRGLANTELTTEFAHRLGKALANRAMGLGEHSLIVGCDGRNSSAELTEALEQGILATGCHVIHLGQVPTPLLNYATHQLSETDCGIMVTASHNPAEYNGFKMFFKRHALCGDEVLSLQAELEQDFPDVVHRGELEIQDLSEAYVEQITSDIVPADELKVVLDAGNGVAGKLGCAVLEAIGCDVIPLYCDIDGDFPNHSPDTGVAANLADLIACVKESSANLGIAFDGDGDRMVAVSASGKIIWPDELLMIFARDVISRHPGADIVFDVKSTNRLNSLISSYGGRPVMWKTGHSHMYNKILECEAPLGGEFSGHIFFHDRWYGFDDGIYAAARLIEIMAIREQGLDEMVANFEPRYSTPEIKIDIADEEKFAVMDKLVSGHNFVDGKISTIDGLRVDLPHGWGLVRASNTSAALTLRFEAESEEALENIKSSFQQQLQSIDSNLTF